MLLKALLLLIYKQPEIERPLFFCRRHDRYGTGGQDPQPLSEKILLGVLTVLLVPVKVTSAVACLVWFYAFCRVSVLIPQQYRGGAVAAAGKLACRLCLLSLGFIHVRWIQQGSQRCAISGSSVIFPQGFLASRKAMQEHERTHRSFASWLKVLVMSTITASHAVSLGSSNQILLVAGLDLKMLCAGEM